MKKIGYALIAFGTFLFLIFKFIVVKIAYFKYPQDKSFNSFWEILIAAYTQRNMQNGVFHEIYGPVSGVKNYIYVLCVLCILLGFVSVLVFSNHRKALSNDSEE